MFLGYPTGLVGLVMPITLPTKLKKNYAKKFQKNIMILSIMLWFCMGDIHAGHCVQNANYAPLQNGATQISRFQSSNDE